MHKQSAVICHLAPILRLRSYKADALVVVTLTDCICVYIIPGCLN